MATTETQIRVSSLWRMAGRFLFLTICLAAVTGLLILFGTGIMTEETVNSGVNIATGIACLLLWRTLYVEAWGTGDRDCNLVQFGRIARQPYKAALAGFLAQLPGLLLAILALLQRQEVLAGTWATWGCSGLYLPFFWLFSLWGSASGYWVYLIPPIVLPLFCQMGYALGYRRISLMQKIVYRQDVPREKDKRMR